MLRQPISLVSPATVVVSPAVVVGNLLEVVFVEVLVLVLARQLPTGAKLLNLLLGVLASLVDVPGHYFSLAFAAS